jgi:hypothetical protein
MHWSEISVWYDGYWKHQCACNSFKGEYLSLASWRFECLIHTMKDLGHWKLASTRGAMSVMLTLSLWLIPNFKISKLVGILMMTKTINMWK